MAGQIAKIKDIKQAVKDLIVCIEEANPTDRMSLKVGIVVEPRYELDVNQVKTALNKYVQALSCFDDELRGQMVLDWSMPHPKEIEVIQAAQAKVTAREKLIVSAAGLKAPTAEQAKILIDEQQATKS